jgi:hypothetical protein
MTSQLKNQIIITRTEPNFDRACEEATTKGSSMVSDLDLEYFPKWSVHFHSVYAEVNYTRIPCWYYIFNFTCELE